MMSLTSLECLSNFYNLNLATILRLRYFYFPPIFMSLGQSGIVIKFARHVTSQYGGLSETKEFRIHFALFFNLFSFAQLATHSSIR